MTNISYCYLLCLLVEEVKLIISLVEEVKLVYVTHQFTFITHIYFNKVFLSFTKVNPKLHLIFQNLNSLV